MRTLLLVLALSLTAGAAPATGGGGAPENLMVIVADDLGIDRVRAYGFLNGQGNPLAPRTTHIDRLASRGVLFRNAWSAPSCSPGRAQALSGLYPNRIGVGGAVLVGVGETTGLRDDTRTVADVLPPAYRRGVIGKWHVASRGPAGNVTQGLDHAPRCGFDFHLGTFANFSNTQDYFAYAMVQSLLVNLSLSHALWVQGEYATTRTTDDALRAVRAFGGDPWFLWVSYNAPHKPYHAPPAELIQSPGLNLNTTLGQGKAMIEALDTEVGRLLSGIPADVLARTTVVFFGDNGTQKDIVQSPFIQSRAKGTIYNGGIHVPLIVAGPRVPAEHEGAECTALVDVSDLLPTAAELCGAPAPAHGDGTSLVPYLVDPTTPSARSWIYAERFKPNFIPRAGLGIADADLTLDEQTARDQRYKLIRKWLVGAGPPGLESFELYDLETDFFEQHNLLDAQGQPPAQLQGAYDALRQVLLRMRS